MPTLRFCKRHGGGFIIVWVAAIGTPTWLRPKDILTIVDEYFFIDFYISVADNTDNFLILLISPQVQSGIGFAGADVTNVIDILV
jgi:hypothetical protein